jgi:O-methyltransferase involved in polyketide biosynthesis
MLKLLKSCRKSNDFAKLDEEGSTQISAVVRTELLDRAPEAFINRHPQAVTLNIGYGLDTRFSRLDNGKVQWYDLDLPETTRMHFFDETDRYRMIPQVFFDYSWIDEVDRKKSVLIIAEGVLMYFQKKM